jgi:hypothetical protein
MEAGIRREWSQRPVRADSFVKQFEPFNFISPENRTAKNGRNQPGGHQGFAKAKKHM